MATRETDVPVKKEGSRSGELQRFDPLGSLRHEIDSLFDDFSLSWPMRSPMRSGPRMLESWRPFSGVLGDGVPAVDIVDEEKSLELKAELPGMDEKDVDVDVSNGMLTIRGEKKEQREEGQKKGRYYMSERRYGAFERAFRLPEGIDTDNIEARFSKGVLTVTMPKTEAAQKSVKKVKVKSD